MDMQILETGFKSRNRNERDRLVKGYEDNCRLVIASFEADFPFVCYSPELQACARGVRSAINPRSSSRFSAISSSKSTSLRSFSAASRKRECSASSLQFSGERAVIIGHSAALVLINSSSSKEAKK